MPVTAAWRERVVVEDPLRGEITAVAMRGVRIVNRRVSNDRSVLSPHDRWPFRSSPWRAPVKPTSPKRVTKRSPQQSPATLGTSASRPWASACMHQVLGPVQVSGNEVRRAQQSPALNTGFSRSQWPSVRSLDYGMPHTVTSGTVCATGTHPASTEAVPGLGTAPGVVGLVRRRDPAPPSWRSGRGPPCPRWRPRPCRPSLRRAS